MPYHAPDLATTEQQPSRRRKAPSAMSQGRTKSKRAGFVAPEAQPVIALTRAEIEPYLPLYAEDPRLAVTDAAEHKVWREVAKDFGLLTGDRANDEIIWQDHVAASQGMRDKDPLDGVTGAPEEFHRRVEEMHKKGVDIVDVAPLSGMNQGEQNGTDFR